ncbi:zinc ribbon domain-containing protein [candidate division WOR-3 bacterium]|nr:zinc ribbon domain-containing protein [candidate division WOR-3 bacterium]
MEIRCPQCDAVIKTGIEHKVVKCPYCSTHLYYEKDKVLTKESIKPTLDARVAESLLHNISGKKLKVKLEYFPFYRIKMREQTIFLPGKKTDLIGINSYIPQGDRITLEIEVPEPDLSVEEALQQTEEGEEIESIGLIYLPFFTSKDDNAVYFVDGARGNILSNRIEGGKTSGKNHHTFALLSFTIIVLVALFFPSLPFRLISVAIITSLLWYYDKGKHHG